METLLSFTIGQQAFAVDSDQVENIQRIPPIAPVPIAHPAILGVAVVDGKTCTVLDIAQALDNPATDTSLESARLINLKVADQHLSIVTEAIREVYPFKEAQFAQNQEQPKLLLGTFQTDHNLLQIIDSEKLPHLASSFEFQPTQVKVPLPNKENKQEITDPQQGNQELFLFFNVGGELFGLQADQVRELVFPPEQLTPIQTEGQPEVMGVMQLRGKLIVVVDLNQLLGFAPQTSSENTRYLVIEQGEKRLALAVEQVEEAVEVSLTQIEAVQNQLTTAGIKGLYQKDTETVVSILSNQFIRDHLAQKALSDAETSTEQQAQTEGSNMAEMAVFSIGDEEYAFDIEEVQEIIKYQPITPVPEPPACVEGVINLRGSIIPVVNLPERLNLQARNPKEKQKIIVCHHSGYLVGFMVDEVEEILFIEHEAETLSEDPHSLIAATLTLDDGKRVILRLRLKKLLSEDALKQLSVAKA